MGGLSCEDIEKLEHDAIDSGISILEMMENAGKGVSDALQQNFDITKKKILFICYHGNNGGDGFVAARHLADSAEVDVLFLGDEEKLKPEALENYNLILSRYDIQFFKDIEIDFDEYDVLVDAMLGIGYEGDLVEPFATVIKRLNASRGYKVSIDVPSGFDLKNGENIKNSISPDLLVTMFGAKKGLESLKDKTVVIDPRPGTDEKSD